MGKGEALAIGFDESNTKLLHYDVSACSCLTGSLQ